MINRYLILDDYHSVPISELNPDSIKESVKKAKSSYLNPDHEKNINHTALLGATVKKLGFDGGFDGFKKEYKERLLPFLKENKLVQRVNLFELKRDSSYFEGFFSPYDRKVFDFASSRMNLETIGIDENRDIILFFQKPREVADRLFLAEKYGIPKNKIDKILIKFPMKIDIRQTVASREELDSNFSDIFNLLGNLLIKPRTELQIILKRYVENPKDNFQILENINKKCYELAKRLLPKIDFYEEGWVEVIPYNDNLIFLKDKNRNYDFVFKNLRDNEPPKLSEYKENLNDIPNYIKEEFEFNTMFYFHEFWEDYERNEAEKFYYANGGKPYPYYPSENKILFDYLKSKENGGLK